MRLLTEFYYVLYKKSNQTSLRGKRTFTYGLLILYFISFLPDSLRRKTHTGVTSSNLSSEKKVHRQKARLEPRAEYQDTHLSFNIPQEFWNLFQAPIFVCYLRLFFFLQLGNMRGILCDGNLSLYICDLLCL